MGTLTMGTLFLRSSLSPTLTAAQVDDLQP